MSWSSKTIARTATRKIAALKASHPRCLAYTLDNGFVADEVPSEYAWKQHADGRGRLTVDSNGKVKIHLHSNAWYELHPAA